MERSTYEQGEAAARALQSNRRMVLCSLRVVAVRSEHFLGRRYVMELASDSRARELRVYRSFGQLMDAIGELGLPPERHAELDRQLFENGCCNLLNILL